MSDAPALPNGARCARRLVFVVSSLEVGGSESKIVRVSNALADLEQPVEIAYLSGPETLLDSVDRRVRVTHLGRRGKFSVGALRCLRRLAADGQCLLAAVNLYPMVYVVPAALGLRASGVRTACLVNMVDIAGRDRRFEPIYAWLLRRCDHVAFGYLAQQRSWIASYSLEPQQTEVIYNGVDEQRYSVGGVGEEAIALRRGLAIADDMVVLGSVGRLAPEKAYDQLILAVAELRRRGRRCCLLLAGQGPERQHLEELVVREGLQYEVRFLGLVRDVRPVLGLLDVFVLPSSSEAFSNAALEAMAMARPVVMSDSGGTLEMLEQGRSGVAFANGDRAALVAALDEVVRSRELRGQLGAAARERVLERFRFTQMVEKYLRLAAA